MDQVFMNLLKLGVWLRVEYMPQMEVLLDLLSSTEKAKPNKKSQIT